MSDDAHEVQKLLRDALAGMPVTIESGLSDKASVTSKLKWIEIALRVFRGPVGRPATALELENKRKVTRTLLLLIWRRSFGAGAGDADQPKPSFVPALVMGETAPAATAMTASGRMVIEIGKHRRVIVDAGVDATALARVLAVLEGR